jgi:hypothetical protein
MINQLTENLGLIHQLLLALKNRKNFPFKKSYFYTLIPKNANNKNTLANLSLIDTVWYLVVFGLVE